MVVLEGNQYGCDGGAGKAIQLSVMLEGKQYSCDGGEGKAIQPWWCWTGTNTVVTVVQGRQYSFLSEIQQHFFYEMKAKLGG